MFSFAAVSVIDGVPEVSFRVIRCGHRQKLIKADAGLAIATFPYSTWDGQWLPEIWNWAVALNLSHRIGAIIASAAILAFIAQIWAANCAGTGVKLGAVLPVALLAIQIFLGATVTWTGLNEHAATLHLLVGAFLLASCWTLTFLSFRFTEHAP